MKTNNVFGIDSKILREMKSLANNESKAEVKSLKTALNAVKDAAARKDVETRKFLQAINLSVDVLNSIEWHALEPLCRKSKNNTYCTWYVWECLVNCRRTSIIKEIEERKAKEKAAKDAKKVNEKAKKIKAKKAEKAKAA